MTSNCCIQSLPTLASILVTKTRCFILCTTVTSFNYKFQDIKKADIARSERQRDVSCKLILAKLCWQNTSIAVQILILPKKFHLAPVINIWSCVQLLKPCYAVFRQKKKPLSPEDHFPSVVTLIKSHQEGSPTWVLLNLSNRQKSSSPKPPLSLSRSF